MPIKNKASRGDTIVEIIFAFAIFSAISVITIAILNRGLGVARTSLETTLVRQQIDSQSEIIRSIRDNIPSLWSSLISTDLLTSNPAPLTNNSDECVKPNDSSKAFFLVPNPSSQSFSIIKYNDGYTNASSYAYVVDELSESRGIWMEVSKAQSSTKGENLNAYDFRIHACWDPVGHDKNMMTLGTIVRVYGK